MTLITNTMSVPPTISIHLDTNSWSFSSPTGITGSGVGPSNNSDPRDSDCSGTPPMKCTVVPPEHMQWKAVTAATELVWKVESC